MAGATKEVLSRHWEFGDLYKPATLPLKGKRKKIKRKKQRRKGEKKKSAKMINVGWTARPSSILLSSLFGRH